MRIIKFVGISIGLVVCSSGKCQELKTAFDSAAYAEGYQMGEYFFTNQLDFYNVDAFHAGAKDGIAGIVSKIQDPQKTEVMMVIGEYVRKIKQEKIDREVNANKAVGDSIMGQNRKNKAIKETASGLQYEVLKEKKGVKPIVIDNVKVHYVGKLSDGTIFDSSRDREQTFIFSLMQQFIEGWTEGIQLMTEGSTYKFWIPSNLGYGDQGVQNVIPGGSLLIFEVELLKINPE
jgi:FKBP-type peptidyl-prolyl cis-trans isomerase FklB